MRDQLEHLLAALAVGAAVAIGAKRIGVPYNVALVLVGLIVVFANFLPPTPMNPEVVLLAFLPALVFEAALFADADGMRAAARPILTLAVPGVAISLFATGAVATYALGLPFTVALLLGALLSITDTVSVLLAFRSVRVPHRLAAIMEGESLFNDGTALVLVSLMATIVAKGSYETAGTIKSLGVAIIGGAIAGAVFGAIGAAVLRKTPDHLTAILASIVLVFGTALLSERVHASPVIAVVVAGLLVGRAARGALEPGRVLALQGFWETAGFALNVILFLLVGMQIDATMLFKEAPSIALALVALHVGRAVVVYGCFAVLGQLGGERVPPRWQHVMVLGNIKGALSMAAVLTLPGTFPYRERLVTIVFGVTFVTLLTQALPFTRVLRLLRVGAAVAAPMLDAAKVALVSAKRGHLQIDELLATGLISRRDHAERRAQLQRRVIAAEATLRGPEGEASRDKVADVAVLQAQKAAVLDAARRGLVSMDAASVEADSIDRALFTFQAHEEDAS